MTSSRSRWILMVAGALAIAWAIARAAVQSITIDEANSYIQFASRHLYLWYAANNHILNSTLMYGFTRVLGLSQFTARLPALIGAGLYIAACYRICRLLGASLFVQLTVFVCLVFNPFIFDYLVAARGYGLALGFFMWALVYPLEQNFLIAAFAVASVCAGMSVNANFSFAFVNVALMIATLLCAWFRRPARRMRLLLAGVLPGAAVIAIVSGYALIHAHSGELIYGAASLKETFETVIEASLFRSPAGFLSPAVFPLVAVTGIAWLTVSFKRMSPLGWIAAAIFAGALAIHWAAFRFFGLLLPKDRTAIFLFPLFVIVAGGLAAIPPPAGFTRHLRAGFLGALVIMAAYFLSCIRLTYFKEWYWDADVQETYAILSCLNREHSVTNVASSWSYHPSLSFYLLAQPASLRIDEGFDPRQAQVHVRDTLHDEQPNPALAQVFYRSPTTDLVMEASPASAEAYAAGSCLRLYKK